MKLILITLSLFLAFRASADATAIIKTDMGEITVKLYNTTPVLTDNFIGLAKGSARYFDINAQRGTKPYYDGMIFHRVHPDLGIFSGCPWGTGRGWPGYMLNDEYSPQAKFDRPGLVSMAKLKGDNRVGSQFFITTKADPRLNGKYPIIGEVIDGMKVVKLIAKADRDVTMKPKRPIHIKHIEIKE